MSFWVFQKLEEDIALLIDTLVEPRGFEPLTSAMRTQRSPE